MLKPKIFNIAMRPGYGDNGSDFMEMDVIDSFEYNGRLYMLHESPYESHDKYRVSDYLTGWLIGSSLAPSKVKALNKAKKALEKNKDFDYSPFRIINIIKP